MLLKKVRVRTHERGLWFRHGEFRAVLGPGVHYFAGGLLAGRRDRVTVTSTLATRFEHPLLDTMLAQPAVRDALHLVDLTDVERALVWKDERLAYVLGPGRHALWKEPYRLYVETFRVNDAAWRFEHPRLAVVLAHPDAPRWLDGVRVNAGEQALLFRDGVLVDRLAEGLHVYWKGTGDVTWRAVDLREQCTALVEQEAMTADRVTLRVGLVLTWQVTDPARAVVAVCDHATALRRAAQLALRAAVASRPLDALLAERQSVACDVFVGLSNRAAEFAEAPRDVGDRDVALPPRIKTLLNRAAAARKERELLREGELLHAAAV
jgi:regulator of protease activity HflC (stomatin/prohibitin superfamily)